jgi:hypothetical protein
MGEKYKRKGNKLTSRRIDASIPGESVKNAIVSIVVFPKGTFIKKYIYIYIYILAQ